MGFAASTAVCFTVGSPLMLAGVTGEWRVVRPQYPQKLSWLGNSLPQNSHTHMSVLPGHTPVTQQVSTGPYLPVPPIKITMLAMQHPQLFTSYIIAPRSQIEEGMS